MIPDMSVTVGELVEYLATHDPKTPVILRDPSHYGGDLDDECVSIEQAMYELGARGE